MCIATAFSVGLPHEAACDAFLAPSRAFAERLLSVRGGSGWVARPCSVADLQADAPAAADAVLRAIDALVEVNVPDLLLAEGAALLAAVLPVRGYPRHKKRLVELLLLLDQPPVAVADAFTVQDIQALLTSPAERRRRLGLALLGLKQSATSGR